MNSISKHPPDPGWDGIYFLRYPKRHACVDLGSDSRYTVRAVDAVVSQAHREQLCSYTLVVSGSPICSPIYTYTYRPLASHTVKRHVRKNSAYANVCTHSICANNTNSSCAPIGSYINRLLELGVRDNWVLALGLGKFLYARLLAVESFKA